MKKTSKRPERAPNTTFDLVSCIDYLHGDVADGEFQAACDYEYARESYVLCAAALGLAKAEVPAAESSEPASMELARPVAFTRRLQSIRTKHARQSIKEQWSSRESLISTDESPTSRL